MKTEIIDGECNRSIPVATKVYLPCHHWFFICGTNINWVTWKNNSFVCFLAKWHSILMERIVWDQTPEKKLWMVDCCRKWKLISKSFLMFFLNFQIPVVRFHGWESGLKFQAQFIHFQMTGAFTFIKNDIGLHWLILPEEKQSPFPWFEI